MESDPGDESAFCPLLWEVTEGRKGHCLHPGDCYTCNIMQNALMNLAAQGVQSLWICPACAALIKKSAEEEGVIAKLPGFYTEGFCQRPQCYRSQVWGEQGRYSGLLQLLTVIGDKIP